MKRSVLQAPGRGQAGLRARNAASRRRRLAIEALEERMAPAVDLTLIGPALAAGPFSAIQGNLNRGALARPVFLLGDQLSTRPAGQVLDQLQQKLSGLTVSANTVDAVKDALVAKLGPWLVAGRVGIGSQGTPDGDRVTFQMTVGSGATYDNGLSLVVDPRVDGTSGSGATFSIQGVAGAGGAMDNAGLIDARVAWTMGLTFGVDASGFFLQTSAADELVLGVRADLDMPAGASVFGKLGILPASFTVTIDPVTHRPLPTGFDGAYSIDLVDPSGDNLLRASEFAQVATTATLGGRDSGNNPVAGLPATARFHMTGSGSFLPKVVDPSQYEVLGLNLGNFFNLGFETDLSYAVT